MCLKSESGGGSGALIAKRLEHRGRTVFLADTFSGVVKAADNDSKYLGGEPSDVSISQVKGFLLDMHVKNVVILSGIFPDDTGHRILGPLALVHIDEDVYQSAKEVLAFALPRLSPGAIVIFDDYGFSGCEGVTKLVNELSGNPNWTFIHNLNRHAIFILR